MSRTPAVVFIHGLWMPGRESHWFRQRLVRRHGFDTVLFSYRSRLEELDAVLDALKRCIEQAARPQTHIVGHSLGGVLALRLFERYPDQPPGRVVFLGSPVQGSAAARRLGSLQAGRRLLGLIANEELVPERECTWRQSRQLGIIAGTRPVGLGRMITRFQEPNDGTVALRETEIAGSTDRMVLPVSHFGMLLSARVADQTARFLNEGCFSLV
jgi:pimeloyl-ACP methyl ester carboxylesterase